MPFPEVCFIHPGALSASSWSRIAAHLPAGVPVRVLELEAINPYWAAEETLTVTALADRLRPSLAVARERLLVGWGVGGAVADALAAPARRVVVLDALAPGALRCEPEEAQLLRSFAMYAGARRGRGLRVDPARLREGLEPALAHIRDEASAVGALRAGTTPTALRRCFDAHAARVLRDHRLVAGYAPTGEALTVVKASDSLAPDSPALGWDRFAPVELLASGGDHYSMLTDPASAVQLAMLLRRWLSPALAV